jgi:ppGpp synthetase/RelA/SpoT-type nucleotidyltranferase
VESVADAAERILVDYDREKVSYLDLVGKVSALLEVIISEAGVVLHSATSRCKDRESLARKIGRPGKSYRALSDITDIAGIRLTTYFADDVDKIAKIIREEFSIDDGSSVDKRIQSDPDRFGYLSLHYIARLSDSRIELVEYRRFKGIRFEIQIRSILQHAWAEIEHDLGYKSVSGVPAEIRRRFARVSGLLELADSEFCAIRDQLASYEKELPSLLEVDQDARELDLPTLKLLIGSDPDLVSLDQAVVDGTGASLDSQNGFIISWTIDRLAYLDVVSVGRLKELARRNVGDVKGFAAYWARNALGSVGVGIGLFYLCYVLVWQSRDRESARKFVERFWGDESESVGHEMVNDILSYKPGSGAVRKSRGEDYDY